MPTAEKIFPVLNKTAKVRSQVIAVIGSQQGMQFYKC